MFREKKKKKRRDLRQKKGCLEVEGRKKVVEVGGFFTLLNVHGNK